MYGIDLLLEEHRNILKFTDHVDDLCCMVIDGTDVDVNEFYQCLDFGRNYADKQHHGKEEKILFRIMMEELGEVAEKVIRNGMLVEHDLGRYHMGELESALEKYKQERTTRNKLAVITHAAGYASLLRRHIEKEDQVVYEFAKRNLDDDLKIKVNDETKDFEKDAEGLGVQEKYVEMLCQWTWGRNQ